jgi:hypothetical protein
VLPKAFLGQGRLPVRGVHTTLAVAGTQGLFKAAAPFQSKVVISTRVENIFQNTANKSSVPNVARCRARCKVLARFRFAPGERYGCSRTVCGSEQSGQVRIATDTESTKP